MQKSKAWLRLLLVALAIPLFFFVVHPVVTQLGVGGGGFASFLVAAFASTLCLLLGLRFLSRTTQVAVERVRKNYARSAQEVLAKVESQPVVYLRAFDADSKRMPGIIGMLGSPPRFEEYLIGRFKVLGPCVAIGRPKEELPELGAARMYLSDENWQTEVTALVREARCVVAFVDRLTPGIEWELEHILMQQYADKLGLVLWFGPAETENRELYELVAAFLRKLRNWKLPPFENRPTAIKFSVQNQPVLVSCPRWWLSFGSELLHARRLVELFNEVPSHAAEVSQ
jgi:hypothetical protein